MQLFLCKIDLCDNILEFLDFSVTSYEWGWLASICHCMSMLSTNYLKGKCWVGRFSVDFLACANPVPPQCRWGSFLRAIGPCDHVGDGDVEHASCGTANSIVKQLNETPENLMKNSATNIARAAREARKALVLELHKLLEERKNIPHAKRLAPWQTEKFDTIGGKMFFANIALHARVVAVL